MNNEKDIAIREGISKERLRKFNKLKKLNDVYPNDFRKKHRLGDIQKLFGANQGFRKHSSPVTVTVAGRIISLQAYPYELRLVIRDCSGELSAVLRTATLNEPFVQVSRLLDVGDIVVLQGVLDISLRGEVFINVYNGRILCKSLLSLEVNSTLADLFIYPLVEKAKLGQRIRQRVLQLCRAHFSSSEFLELMTPSLQEIPQPDAVQCECEDKEFALRPTKNFCLPMFAASGIERCFEIGSSFRNGKEGVFEQHGLFAFAAFTDADWMQNFLSDCLKNVALCLREEGLWEREEASALFGPWKKLSLRRCIAENGFVDYSAAGSNKYALEEQRYPYSFASLEEPTKLSSYFEDQILPKIKEPVVVSSYPDKELLARDNDNGSNRFDILFAGKRIATASTFENDPNVLLKRYPDEAKEPGALRNFLRALEFGIPPGSLAYIDLEALFSVLTTEKFPLERIFS